MARQRAGSDDDRDKPFRPRSMRYTIGAAVALFTVGSLMLYYGVLALPTEKDRAIGMLVTGALAFIPGSYATWTIFGAWMGWRGYDMHELPSYDEG
jgi:hypothetical protein